MKKYKFKKYLAFAKRFLLVTVGCALFGIAVNMFFVPAGLNTGGLTGIAMIFNYLFDTPTGVLVLLMNIPLIILAVKYIGFRFLLWTIIATVISSLFIDLTVFLPELIEIGETEDRLLYCIFGGACSGVGLGIVFTQGASTGGTDIIARLCGKFFPHITLGRAVLLTDLTIVTIGAIVNREIGSALYSAIALFISSSAIDMVIFGMDKSQAAIIVTSKSEEINARLLQELERGVTRINSRGGYSGTENETLICAVNVKQIGKLRDIVKECDENAFLIFTEVHDIIGEGFKQI